MIERFGRVRRGTNAAPSAHEQNRLLTAVERVNRPAAGGGLGLHHGPGGTLVNDQRVEPFTAQILDDGPDTAEILQAGLPVPHWHWQEVAASIQYAHFPGAGPGGGEAVVPYLYWFVPANARFSVWPAGPFTGQVPLDSDGQPIPTEPNIPAFEMNGMAFSTFSTGSGFEEFPVFPIVWMHADPSGDFFWFDSTAFACCVEFGDELAAAGFTLPFPPFFPMAIYQGGPHGNEIQRPAPPG